MSLLTMIHSEKPENGTRDAGFRVCKGCSAAGRAADGPGEVRGSVWCAEAGPAEALDECASLDVAEMTVAVEVEGAEADVVSLVGGCRLRTPMRSRGTYCVSAAGWDVPAVETAGTD